MPAHRQPLDQRLARLTDKSAGPDGCWPWLGTQKIGNRTRRYGRININGKHRVASRVIYELHHGPIPEGLFVCHRCDNPPCVNPAHLFLGTAAANARDRDGKGRLDPARCVQKTPMCGERNGQARLTATQVHAIRRQHADGLGYRTLARRHQLGVSTIADICTRRTWAHLP